MSAKTLREAQIEGNLEAFIKEHEPLDAPKEAVQRYIDASATPLDNRKASPSKSPQGGSDDYR